MDIDKLISRGAVAVPLIHVITCGIYIVGYAMGFGGSIGSLFSPSDFFTVTIQHLATVYVTGLGVPIAFNFFRNRSTVARAGTSNNAIPNDPPSELVKAIWRGISIGIDILLVFFGLLFFVILLAQIWTGWIRTYYLTFLAMWMGTLPFWSRYAVKRNIYGLKPQLYWIGATFAISVLGMSLTAGEVDRRASYSNLKTGRMLCKNHVILSSIGDRFITVTSDNNRHIVSDECEVFADLEKLPMAATGPLSKLVREKIRETLTDRQARIEKAETKRAEADEPTDGTRRHSLQPTGK